MSGQELGARLSRPDDWARDYWIAFDGPDTDWLPGRAARRSRLRSSDTGLAPLRDTWLTAATRREGRRGFSFGARSRETSGSHHRCRGDTRYRGARVSRRYLGERGPHVRQRTPGRLACRAGFDDLQVIWIDTRPLPDDTAGVFATVVTALFEIVHAPLDFRTGRLLRPALRRTLWCAASFAHARAATKWW